MMHLIRISIVKIDSLIVNQKLMANYFKIIIKAIIFIHLYY